MNELVLELLYLLGGAIVSALGVALTNLTNKWAAKTKSEYFSGVIRRLDDLAMLVVSEVNQAFRKPRERDGKWTDEARDDARRAAEVALRSYLGSKGLKELLKVAGNDKAALDSLIGTAIESAVDRQKKR